MEYLYILQQAMVWIITIYWIYQLVISLCSLIKVKEKPLVEEKEHRFMAIIPAHNEEKVISNLVESLKNQNYSKNLYDIYSYNHRRKIYYILQIGILKARKIDFRARR